MTKIIATMATYPGRSEVVEQAAASMAGQVDTLNLVLNEYLSVPDWVSRYTSINPIIPETDTKDTGKYLVPIAAKDWLFTIDDDIIYPSEYVKKSLNDAQAINISGIIAGYHGVTYKKPRFMPTNRYLRMLLGRDQNYLGTCFNAFRFHTQLDKHYFVDELGTGTTFSRGEDVPAFSFVQSAQKFIDVRVARWCHQTKRPMVCLARADQWLKQMDVAVETSIYTSFTLTRPGHVAREIEAYAFRNRGAGHPM